ncbi:hypothetical protein JMUB7507_26450 [Staphylococcus aureus]
MDKAIAKYLTVYSITDRIEVQAGQDNYVECIQVTNKAVNR